MSRRVPIRWVTLGEAVAIAAVAISGLTLYNSWHERNDPPAALPARHAQPLTLRATASADGSRLALAPAVAAQIVQSQTIAFPKALGVAPGATTGDPRVEASWVERPLREADEHAGRAAGDRTLPILVTTRYVEDGADRSDVCVYRLGYAVESGGLFSGRHVRLRGLSLSARGVTGGQARIDAWKPPAGKS